MSAKLWTLHVLQSSIVSHKPIRRFTVEAFGETAEAASGSYLYSPAMTLTERAGLHVERAEEVNP